MKKGSLHNYVLSSRRSPFFTFVLLISSTLLFTQASYSQTCSCGSNLAVNGGFEQPDVPGTGFDWIANGGVPGWINTAENVIEIWNSGFNGVPAYEGSQFAEMNGASTQGVYIQNIPTCPGQVISWSIAHRGRNGVDVANLEIGPVGGPFTVVQVMSDDNTRWGTYSGTYTVPAGQTTTQVVLRAVSATGGTTSGNFVDAFTFTPLCDADGDGVPDAYDCDAQDKKNDKYVICHNGQTICVARQAWESAHQYHAGDHLGACTTTVTQRSIEPEAVSVVASQFTLSGSPNPFKAAAKLQYSVPVDSKVVIKVFDLMGREVSTLVNAERKAGVYSETVDGSKMNTGVYYARMMATAGGKQIIQTQKLVRAE